MEQWFLIFAVVAGVVVSFLLGYMVARYSLFEECKPLMRMGTFIYK